MARSPLFAVVLLLGFSLPLLGQFQPGGKLLAEIPFSFYAGDRAFLPGSYTVDRTLSPEILRLRSVANPQSIATLVVGLGAYPLGNGRSPQLVFLRYDSDHAFLRQAWDSGLGLNLPRCRAEREHVSSRLVTSKLPVVVVIGTSQFAR